MNDFFSYVFKVLFIAALYFVTAKLSAFLAIPPGYATPVWPAAGVALAGVLVWGNRLALGVFLGSLCTNVLIAIDNGATLEAIGPLIGSFSIAVGATLQACLSAFLIKSFISFPCRLTKEREIFILLFWGGPVGSLINSIIGPISLLFTGVISVNDLLLNSFNWWIGDTIGVILFAPLLVLLMTQNVSMLRKVIVTVPILLFTVLTIFVFFNTKESQFSERQNEFDKSAQSITSEFEKNIQSYLNVLTATERFFNASEYVSFDEFELFASKFLELYNGIHALSWNPIVKLEERESFEKSIQEQGFPEFQIKDRFEVDLVEAAPERDRYSPVAYIIPYRQNKAAHGFDTYGPDKVSGNSRQVAQDKARDQGKPISTGRVSVIQAAMKYGVLVYNPVYSNSLSGNSVEERRQHVVGYTAGVFILPQIVAPIRTLADASNMDIVLRERISNSSSNLLYDSRTLNHKEPTQDIVISPQSLRTIHQFNFAGQVWEIEFIQKNDGLLQSHGWSLWYILVGGLFLSSLFGAFLLTVSAQTETTIRSFQEEYTDDKAYIIPVLCTGLTIVLSVILFYMLDTQQKRNVDKITAQENINIQQLIKQNIENSVVAIRRMAQRWEVRGGTPEAEWREDAHHYIQDNVALSTLEWVDNTFHIRYVEPARGNENIIGLNIAFDEKRRELLVGASERDSVTLTSPLDLVQGYRGIISYIPIYVEDRFDGFMVGVFDLKSFLNMALPRELYDYFDIRIVDGDDLVFEYSRSEKEFHYSDLTDVSSTQLFNRHWIVAISPNEYFLKRQLSYLPKIVLMGGILASILVGFAIYYAMISRFHSQQLVRKAEQLADSENKFRHFSERMQLILDNAGEGIYGLDLDGKTIFANDAAVKILGYRFHEMMNVRQHELIHHHKSDGSVYPISECRIYKTIKTGVSQNVSDEVFWHKDGHSIPVEYTVAPITLDSGIIEGAVVIFKDITERKENEVRLIEAKNTAEDAMKAKSEFLARMSHEIRTPMNGIIGTVSLLESTEMSDKQKKYADTIKKSGQSLLVIVNEILDFSSLEAGEIRISNEAFNIREALDQVQQLFKVPVMEKGLQFEIEYDTNIPKYFYGDPGRIRQVIINLINNALKFTDNGSIRVQLSIQEQGNGARFVKVAVHDSGIGIPEDKHADLFQAFSQVDTSSVRKAGGTGLGLSICKGIVEMMGGAIGFDSVLGIGSCFWFIIPLCEPTEDQIMELLENRINTSAITEYSKFDASVLLVEDVEVNVFVVNEMLEEFGCRVDFAENGQVAIEKALSNTYDLILMDCQMPIMDGFDATKEIRKTDTITPIVALTANVLAEERDKCFAAGMVDFISKPVTKESLGMALNEWLKDLSLDKTDYAAIEDKLNTDVKKVAPASVVNHDVIAQFGKNAAKLVQLTLQDADKYMDDIGAAIDSKNPEDLKIAAHSLKSIVAQVGADDLSDMANFLEDLGKNGKLKGSKTKWAKMQDAYKDVKAELQIYFDHNEDS